MSKKRKYYASALLGLFLSACSPVIDQRGNRPDEDNVASINPGIDNKQRVYELIGSPSTLSSFDDRTWYYISKKTETLAFLEPEVTEQQILAIRFDDHEIVQDMKIYDESDGTQIAYVDRETPTEGNEYTILQQLLGNIGRFTKGEDSGSTP